MKNGLAVKRLKTMAAGAKKSGTLRGKQGMSRNPSY